MNKGKPSGFKAETKTDPGVKSSSRPRQGQAGAGSEWTERKSKSANKRFDPSLLRSVGEGNDAGQAVNPFPEVRNGASTNGKAKGQVIHFEFTDGKAENVCIAGTFNDWHPNATPMIHLGDGKWRKDLLLAPGEYEYRLLVDGIWLTDPDCAEHKQNGFGETNSVVLVPNCE